MGDFFNRVGKYAVIPFTCAFYALAPVVDGRAYAGSALEQTVLSNPKYTSNDNFAKDDDTTVLARLIYGEARGDSEALKYQKAWTVFNRANKNNKGIKYEALRPKQYSCFNLDNVNRKKLADPLAYEQKKVWEDCYRVADNMVKMTPEAKKFEHNATHYFERSYNPKFRIKTPKWARGVKPSFEVKGKYGTTIFVRTK